MKLGDLKKLVNDAYSEYGANCEVDIDKLDIILPDQTHKEINVETGVKRTHGLREDYYQGCYYDLDTKSWATGETMTLRRLLDCWWNSVHIDGNTCFKNVYLEDAEYELGELKEEDLDRLVKVDDMYDYDGDGYPTVCAEFVEEN